jgi:HCOMODA/2-hydroxy-3-carboxy-muconic semialdehyde decarboxylase
MLVQKPEEGASLARALGNHSLVLMRRHGATVAAVSLREVVFRTIYGARNAEYQTQARLIGKVTPLSRGETEMAGALPKQPNTLSRAWEYWVTRLAKAGGMPPKGSVARKAAVSMTTSRKPAKKKAAAKKNVAKKKGGKR